MSKRSDIRRSTPGNRNSAGHKNAAGSHKGAPAGNRNAEKDGAYSTVFFDMLTLEERELVRSAPVQGREALEHEMQILKFREHRILTKIAEYEAAPEEALYLNSVTDMREPAGRGKDRKDGAAQQMGMYQKDSAFARILKLQEALYKVQGRIAKIADSLRAMEENKERLALERERLEIMRIRATGGWRSATGTKGPRRTARTARIREGTVMPCDAVHQQGRGPMAGADRQAGAAAAGRGRDRRAVAGTV
mgnify:CR=1 FL=1